VSAGLISVVLPCFDAERFLPTALDSILEQTHLDLEVIAVDDGSHDSTREILSAYARRDRRVRVLVNENNLGLIRTLNRGVAEARGSFIARMDADDVAAPVRLERQIQFLAERPDLAVVGAGAHLIDEEGRVLSRLPVRCRGPVGAGFLALFATPIVHPTMMARADVLKRYPYRLADECLHVEDYELFTRMIAEGVGLGNVDESLHRLRIRVSSVSRRYEQTQVANFLLLARAHQQRTLGFSLQPEVLRAFVNRIDPSVACTDLTEALERLDRVLERFLGGADRCARDRDEVMAIAHQQRVDILTQALLKGSWRLRRTALAGSLRYAPSLLSLPALRHMGVKVGL
jgi:glycosyltransferase involved in cell wall biosynthesis